MESSRKQSPPDEEAEAIMKLAIGTLYNSDRKEPSVLKAHKVAYAQYTSRADLAGSGDAIILLAILLIHRKEVPSRRAIFNTDSMQLRQLFLTVLSTIS